MATTTVKQPGIRHIIDDTRYPDWLRTHTVFQKLNKLSKVFPSIGLPNISEEAPYSNILEAKQDAQQLLYTEVRAALNPPYNKAYNDSKTALANLLYTVISLLAYDFQKMIVEADGKISLKMPKDVLDAKGAVLFKNGESFFKVYNKLIELCKEGGCMLPALETLPAFKSFSTSNVPGGRKYHMTFASCGEEGAWDIATISMRGISSCQTWGTPQSRGLIGSISSKYVGVAYLTSGEKFSDHGTKMLRRAMVRYAINKTTKKPALLVDRIYPGNDQAAISVFATFLKKHTKLPVLFPNDVTWTQYYLPAEESLKYLGATDITYMDTKITPKSALAHKSYDAYYRRLAHLDHTVSTKVHNAVIKKLEAYCENKKQYKEEFRGGVANLLLSMKKHLSTRSSIYTSLCLPVLYSYVGDLAIMPKAENYESEQQYEKAVIKKSCMNFKFWRSISVTKFNGLGKFTKFYPNSSNKLLDLLLAEYKKALIEAYRELCRQ